eukprot:384881-Rhodomonas_salina.3
MADTPGPQHQTITHLVLEQRCPYPYLRTTAVLGPYARVCTDVGVVMPVLMWGYGGTQEGFVPRGATAEQVSSYPRVTPCPVLTYARCYQLRRLGQALLSAAGLPPFMVTWCCTLWWRC